MHPDPQLPRWQSAPRAFLAGVQSIFGTVLTLVLFATYLGIGALAHDTGFSLLWVLASTWLIWAGPAQIILISTLGSGATVLQAAIAVTLSAIRLFPMVVSIMPMLRTARTTKRHLILPSHFVAVTLWVECFRLLPAVPRERRIPFTIGLGVGLVSSSSVATVIGFYLAASLPPLLGAAILLLTPLAFLLSTARNSARLSDAVALLLGLALFPLVAFFQTGVDILISGVAAGTIGYGIDRLRRRRMSGFIGDPSALLVLLLAGVLPNGVWRMLGLWLGGGIDENLEVLVWVKAVATAILAGVIAQILVLPPGALASIAAPLRYGAVAIGFAAFVLSRRSIFVGVVTGEAAMLAGQWWFG